MLATGDLDIGSYLEASRRSTLEDLLVKARRHLLDYPEDADVDRLRVRLEGWIDESVKGVRRAG